MESEEQEWIEAPDGWGATKEEHEENDENGGSAVLDCLAIMILNKASPTELVTPKQYICMDTN